MADDDGAVRCAWHQVVGWLDGAPDWQHGGIPSTVWSVRLGKPT